MSLSPIGTAGVQPFSGVAAGIGPDIDEAKQSPDGKTFGMFLQQAIGDVNSLQNNANSMVQKFSTGEKMDVHEVMIAMEQASTAMALTVQIRNKIVDAYQEIMRTQV